MRTRLVATIVALDEKFFGVGARNMRSDHRGAEAAKSTALLGWITVVVGYLLSALLFIVSIVFANRQGGYVAAVAFAACGFVTALGACGSVLALSISRKHQCRTGASVAWLIATLIPLVALGLWNWALAYSTLAGFAPADLS